MSQNGKGSKRRPKAVDYKTWENNWNNIFGDKNLNGVRVKIKIKDENNNIVNRYGYITRRLSSHLYEISDESTESLYYVSPKDFKEIKRKNK